MKTNNIFKVITVVSALGLATSVLAGNGSAGTTSTGTSSVTATVANTVKISFLENSGNIAFGSLTALDQTATQTLNNICIYNNAADTYKITLSSANNASGNMRLSNGAVTPSYMNYTAEWYASSTAGAAGAGTALTQGTQSSAFSGASETDLDCGGSTGNASLRLSIASAQLEAAPPGAYTDTLSITVAQPT